MYLWSAPVFCSTTTFFCLSLLNVSISQRACPWTPIHMPHAHSKQFCPLTFSTPAHITDNYLTSRPDLPPEFQIHKVRLKLSPSHTPFPPQILSLSVSGTNPLKQNNLLLLLPPHSQSLLRINGSVFKHLSFSSVSPPLPQF